MASDPLGRGHGAREARFRRVRGEVFWRDPTAYAFPPPERDDEGNVREMLLPVVVEPAFDAVGLVQEAT